MLVGDTVGYAVGEDVGATVGFCVGATVAVGPEVGTPEGSGVGAAVGSPSNGGHSSLSTLKSTAAPFLTSYQFGFSEVRRGTDGCHTPHWSSGV